MSNRSLQGRGRGSALPTIPPCLGRRLPALSITLALALVVAPARADSRSVDVSDDAPIHPHLERLDQAPHELWATSGPRAPLWIAIDVSMHKADAIDARSISTPASFGAMLLLGVPLDRLTAPRPRLSQGLPAPGSIAEGSPADRAVIPPALKPPPRAPRAEAAPPPKLPPAPAAEVQRPKRVPVVVTPAAARSAVDAAHRHARSSDPDARIDALATRARASAALPELRLRASRTVDEGQALMPTEYDPARTTAKGSVSIWLEARATWRLDRLVFADEEVALERMRHERAEARAKVTSRVLALLFSWQRAIALADDPSASPEELLAAALKAIEAEAELDLLTGGWFSRWKAAQGTPSLPGVEPPRSREAQSRP